MRLLNQLTTDTGSSLLFITHDLCAASTLADRLVVMRNSRVLETGTPREIIEHPRHPYVASLVASHLALEGPTLRSAARVCLMTAPLLSVHDLTKSLAARVP